MSVFDRPHYAPFTQAKMRFLDEWLPPLISTHHLTTALDVGCGVGYFSGRLVAAGLQVRALDGRSDNVDEARHRHPATTFTVHNIEDLAVRALGASDLVLCFGLLYHLENPFVAVRNLSALTGKIALIETVVVPGVVPGAAIVEEVHAEDQALAYIALVPSFLALVKILYQAGYSGVHTASVPPDHSDFHPTWTRRRKRVMFLAAKVPLHLPSWRLVAEPTTQDPWVRPWYSRVTRVGRFLRRLRPGHWQGRHSTTP